MSSESAKSFRYHVDPKTGIIVDENGIPCKTCNTFRAMRQAAQAVDRPTRIADSSADLEDTAELNSEAAYLWQIRNCPPDVEILGSSTWTLLHTIAATYPEKASASQARDTEQFFYLFGNLYPCAWCAQDYRKWIETYPPATSGRDELGLWLCRAHNVVNAKLGKPLFDCSFWKERWVFGSKGCNGRI